MVYKGHSVPSSKVHYNHFLGWWFSATVLVDCYEGYLAHFLAVTRVFACSSGFTATIRSIQSRAPLQKLLFFSTNSFTPLLGYFFVSLHCHVILLVHYLKSVLFLHLSGKGCLQRVGIIMQCGIVGNKYFSRVLWGLVYYRLYKEREIVRERAMNEWMKPFSHW